MPEETRTSDLSITPQKLMRYAIYSDLLKIPGVTQVRECLDSECRRFLAVYISIAQSKLETAFLIPQIHHTGQPIVQITQE